MWADLGSEVSTKSPAKEMSMLSFDAGSTVCALSRSSRFHSQPQPKVAMSTGDHKCDEKVVGEHCRVKAIYAFQSTASRMRLPRS